MKAKFRIGQFVTELKKPSQDIMTDEFWEQRGFDDILGNVIVLQIKEIGFDEENNNKRFYILESGADHLRGFTVGVYEDEILKVKSFYQLNKIEGFDEILTLGEYFRYKHNVK